jgi:hypothetical protein
MLRPLVLVLLALAPGCGSSHNSAPDTGPACTEIGCGPTLKIRFDRPSWPAGSYQIQVTADGATAACSVTIPLACNAPSACTGGGDLSPELSGCALDPALQRIEGVSLAYTTPASVMVRVVQDERELGTGSFTPTYATSQPNGAACPPVCHGAPNANLTVAP